MSRKLCLYLLATFVLAPVSIHAADKQPSRARLGEKIANVAFHDENNKTLRLHDLKDRKAIAIVFLSFDCPVSNQYTSVLTDLAKELGPAGVSFIGITTNDDDTRADVARHAKEFRFNFPVYQDDKLQAADALSADVTPEVFILDGTFTLRYRGRIDNGYSERLKKHAQISRHDLKVALQELLAGKDVSEPATLAVGCHVPREVKTIAKEGAVTYHRDVVPIMQAHCQSCHRPGEVGPFSLMTYKQAVNWADDIKSFTQKRTMPPWKVTGGPSFHNERRLAQKEIDVLAAWVDGGTPEGNRSDAPPARVFTEGWQFGKPDIVLTPTSEFVLGPDGKDVFRCFVMPTNLPEDVYVTAVEVRPANARIVHHALLFIDTLGQARKLEEKAQKEPAAAAEGHDKAALDSGPGYSVAMGVGFIPQGGLTGWAPGQMPRYFPDNSGILLPKKSDVVMQVHYHRNGRAEKDRTQVGLYFSKKPVERPFGGGAIAGRSGPGPFGMFFSIPAGEERFTLKGETYAQKDFTLYTVMPHMHMLGKEITLTMTPPDGNPHLLIDIKSWDYNWQETYFLKEPIQVKAGTKFNVEARYDNSGKNAMNPFNPPRRITFGEQTFNEMCFVFLGGSSSTTAASGGRRSLPLGLTPPTK